MTIGKSNLDHQFGATCGSIFILERTRSGVERRGTMAAAWFLKEKALLLSDLKLVLKIYSQIFSFIESLSETNVILELEVKGNYFYSFAAFWAQGQHFHISVTPVHHGRDSYLV